MKTLRLLLALFAIAFSLNLSAQGKVGVYLVPTDVDVAPLISDIPEDHLFLTEDWEANDFMLNGHFLKIYVHLDIINDVNIYFDDGLSGYIC